MELLIRLLLAHMLGDFSFQSYALATMKRKGWKGLVIHSFLLTLITSLLTIGASPWWWVITLVVGVMHFALDTARSSIPLSSPIEELAYFIGDQFAHLALILMVVLTFEGRLPRWTYGSPQEAPLHLRLMIIAIAFIVIIWVIPLMEVYTLNLSSRCATSPRSNRVDFVQRILGSLERTLAVILFVYAGPLVGLLPFLPRIFLRGNRTCNLIRAGVSLALTLPVALVLLAISSG